jgi:hypothetical protein
MCDGILSEKLKILREIIDIGGMEGSQEFMECHIAWTLDELKTYRDKLSLSASGAA